jgi:hypothetical protein
MAVAGLVVGILGVVVFCWLGPFLGIVWFNGFTIENAANNGARAAITWPFWTAGLIVGVVIPLLAVVLSAFGLARGQRRGVGIAGIITGAFAGISGLSATLMVAHLYINPLTEPLNERGNPVQFQAASDQFQEMQKKLDDPKFQEEMLKAMQAAAENAATGQKSAGDTETAKQK